MNTSAVEIAFKAALFAVTVYYQIDYIYNTPVASVYGLCAFLVSAVVAALVFGLKKRVTVRGFLVHAA